ncbi:hypothetical protein [Natranaerobius trueperi]|nr:hypothetical protein [Natranaerobius trueperi]
MTNMPKRTLVKTGLDISLFSLGGEGNVQNVNNPKHAIYYQ